MNIFKVFKLLLFSKSIVQFLFSEYSFKFFSDELKWKILFEVNGSDKRFKSLFDFKLFLFKLNDRSSFGFIVWEGRFIDNVLQWKTMIYIIIIS